jgi:Ankyrin repeat.
MGIIMINQSKRVFFTLSFVAALTTSALSFGMDIFTVEVFSAVERGNINRLEGLARDRNFNANKTNKNGETLLYRACECKRSEIVKFLLDKGADVNKENNNKKSEIPLFWFV